MKAACPYDRVIAKHPVYIFVFAFPHSFLLQLFFTHFFTPDGETG